MATWPKRLVDNPYVGSDIAGTCFHEGYVGRSDAFIIAFIDPEHLESFREYNSFSDVRVALVLGPGSPITQSDIDDVSPLANAIVVPADRLVGSEGQILDLVKSSKMKWIVSGANDLDSESLAIFKELDSILAFIDSSDPNKTTTTE